MQKKIDFQPHAGMELDPSILTDGDIVTISPKRLVMSELVDTHGTQPRTIQKLYNYVIHPSPMESLFSKIWRVVEVNVTHAAIIPMALESASTPMTKFFTRIKHSPESMRIVIKDHFTWCDARDLWAAQQREIQKDHTDEK